MYSDNDTLCRGGDVPKFFISYTSKDSEKAQWIGWTLKDLGHEAFVHEWEIGGGQDIAEWMESKLDESDHLIGVFSPDYIDAAYSKSERHAAYWSDPLGRERYFMPVVVRPLPIRLTPMTATCRVPPLSRVEFGIGWSGGVARDAEQRAEGVERVKPPVEAEGELVEVGL